MPNPPNQRDPDQDPRNNGKMEDSTAMRIEFLRARLLAERSVSRTARQRADELVKRVVELEEQLKIVCLQRKKAEKATANVLAILGNHGISDISEEFDTSSDQDVVHSESKVGANSPEEEESSVSSEIRSRNHADEFSSCDLDSSPLPSKSLSWKGGKDSSHSCEKKCMDSSGRRRSTFTSPTSGSPRCRLGKSCRQIRRREMRSTVEESEINSGTMTSQDTAGATCSQDGSEKDMERALEEQAQLIGQYEEEEKAQREWEEKFRENSNSTPDSCEPGDQSDVTDERDETKAQSRPYTVQTIASQSQDRMLKVEDICVPKESVNSQSDGLKSIPCADTECFQDQNPGCMLGNESSASDFVLPAATRKQDQLYSGNYNIPPSSCLHSSHLEGSPGNQSTEIVPSHSGSSVRKKDTSGSKNVNYALMPHEGPNKLGSVLESLEQAKLSLKHQLTASSSVDGGSFRKSIGFSAQDRPEVPASCTGLFRVPSDFHLEATSKANLLHSNVQLSLTNYSHDSGSIQSVDDRFVTGQHTESTRSSVSIGDRRLAIPTSVYMHTYNTLSGEPVESWSRFSSHKPFFGTTLDTGLPSSSRYPYNDLNTGIGPPLPPGTNTSSFPFYPDLMLRMPANEVPQPISTRGAGIPLSNGGLQLIPAREPGMPLSNRGPHLVSSRGPGMSLYNERLQFVPGGGPGNGMPPSTEQLQLISSRGPGIPLSNNERRQLVPGGGPGMPVSNEGPELVSSRGPRMPVSNERQQLVSGRVAGRPLANRFSIL